MRYLKLLLLISAIILCTATIVAIENVNGQSDGGEGNNETNQTENVTVDNNLLEAGKNTVLTSESFNPIYVRDFITAYPEIEAVSYKEEGEEDTKGFINFLGGIGENFIMYPNTEYEIATKQQITIENL